MVVFDSATSTGRSLMEIANLMDSIVDLLVPEITGALDEVGGIPIPELPGFTLDAPSVERARTGRLHHGGWRPRLGRVLNGREVLEPAWQHLVRLLEEVQGRCFTGCVASCSPAILLWTR